MKPFFYIKKNCSLIYEFVYLVFIHVRGHVHVDAKGWSLESSITPHYSLGKHLSTNPKSSIYGVLCGQLAPRIPCFILRIVAGGQLVSSGISMSTSLACNKHCNHWALSVTLRITHFERTHIRVAFKKHLSQAKTEIFIKLGARILICGVL